MVDSTKYVGLITSEHAGKPKFVAVIEALSAGFVDSQNLDNQMPSLFSLDSAVGAQLDAVGVWIGFSRTLSIPLTGVYFSWDDTDLLGWDSGSWQSVTDSPSGLITLPDDAYRRLLRSKIAANHWDSTIPGAIEVFLTTYNGAQSIILQDLQDMSFILGFVGVPLSAVDQALLTHGYISLKPAGVHIAAIALPVAPGPLFAWDVLSTTLNGWDAGQWALEIQPVYSLDGWGTGSLALEAHLI